MNWLEDASWLDNTFPDPDKFDLLEPTHIEARVGRHDALRCVLPNVIAVLALVLAWKWRKS